MSTQINKKEKQPSGISHLLELLDDSVNSKNTVAEKIDVILTLDERVSIDVARNTLTARQICFIDKMQDASNVGFSKECDQIQDKVTFVLGARPYGRIVLDELSVYEISDEDESSKNIIYGYVFLDASAHAEAVVAASAIEAVDLESYQLAENYLRDISKSDLTDMIDEIEHTHVCMAPVIYYIGDKTVSNFYGFTSKTGGYKELYLNSFIDSLKEKDVQSWESHEVNFVYTIYYLLKSGPHTRSEEFNAQQLNPLRLEAYFDEKWSCYLDKLHGMDKKLYISEYAQAGIPAKASMIKKLRGELEKEYLFFRDVNGLNLHKTEQMVIANEVGGSLFQLPSDIKKYISGTYNVDIGSYSDTFQLFKEVTEIALEASFNRNATDLLSPIEELLHVVVSSAVTKSNSEIGMTRGLRRIHEVIRAQQDENFEEASAWPQTNYYCYVVPSDEIIKQIPKDKLRVVLNAISARMRFNSWHYLPGNYQRSQIPEKRDYYIPPKMPDTAVWSDQHHPGHVHAAVRNSIRSPSYVTIKGKKYLAFFDLRLMRSQGDAYTRNDLMVAVQYTNYLRYIYQAVVDNLVLTDREYDFVFGTKSWYQAFYKINNESEELKYA